MTTAVYLSPYWSQQQFTDNNNNLLVGGTITAYEAGSFTVEQTTWSDHNGTTPNSNPIVLDANGRCSTELWLQLGTSYNLVLRDQYGNILSNLDNLIAPVASTVAGSVSNVNLWNQSTTPTYVSANKFQIAGNVTADYVIGNRVKFTNGTNGPYYGTVTAVSVATNTQITIQPDSVAVASNVNTVYWSALIANAITVDADAVSYSTSIPYSGTNTVGGQIATLKTTLASDVTSVNNSIQQLQEVFSAGGTGAYTLTLTIPPTSYATNMIYNVYFPTAGGASPTINVNGLGAKNIYQSSTGGTFIPASITAGMTSVLLYQGSYFVLMNPNPPSINVITGGGVYPDIPATEAFATFTLAVTSNVTVTAVSQIAAGGSPGTGTIYIALTGTSSASSPVMGSSVNGSFSVVISQTYCFKSLAPGNYSVAAVVGGLTNTTSTITFIGVPV